MDNHVAIIHNDPAGIGCPFDAAFFVVLLARFVIDTVRKRVQHAVAGAGADDEIIGKGCDFVNIEQDNIFALLFFQGIYNGMSKIKRFQFSPRVFCCAELIRRYDLSGIA